MLVMMAAAPGEVTMGTVAQEVKAGVKAVKVLVPTAEAWEEVTMGTVIQEVDAGVEAVPVRAKLVGEVTVVRAA